MNSEVEMYWNELNRRSPATHIVVNQDYEGVITVTVEYPGWIPIETTGHTTLWQGLRTTLECVKEIERMERLEAERAVITTRQDLSVLRSKLELLVQIDPDACFICGYSILALISDLENLMDRNEVEP